jgi:hypothetical protein
MWKETSAFMIRTKGLNMEAAGSSEMFVTAYQTTVHCVSSEDYLTRIIFLFESYVF